ncbi:uncharacterized protein LOC123426081 [Hordeum vulgare subsp. vulgare]|uniref:uncharacterized protein LOC123426081 n=1 Tax=Hordeum vulgare subsp. vulgare TaxID=112509 RepID=UPI001D1A4934|nr:uncharacterized protein LOC123426081 [Hordeum vulgare subsp. vulgare]
MVPNKEGISLTREEASTRYATSPSLERSTGNPEREVKTTRTVKGAFSGATKLGGDPRGVLCGDPRVKAKMRLSSRGRSRSWRWEQEAEGSAGLFEGMLCDPATGTEVLSWRPGSREADPRSGMRRRYRGLGRAFSKMRGLVVAGDEQDGEITCVHQGFRFDEDSHGVGNFKTLLFSEKEVTVFGCRNPKDIHGMRQGVGKEIQNKHKECAADGPAKKVRGGDKDRDLCA